MNKKIQFEGETWSLNLSESHELSFSFVVPYSRSVYATNPLWHSWDMEPEEDEQENFYFAEGISHVNIFQLKSFLFKEIVKFIQEANIDFFYFTPNTDQKSVIYTRISQELVDALGKGWSVQSYVHWFYFSKINL